MAMTFQFFTVDDESGFQAEHQDLLTKLEDYKNAITALREGISEAEHIEDQDEREEKILTLEQSKFQTQLDYASSKVDLVSKVIEVFGLGENVEDDFYFFTIPDQEDISSDLIFCHV